MAQRIDVPKEMLTKAIEMSIASLKRANTNERNPIIIEARQKEISTLQIGLNTVTEIK